MAIEGELVVRIATADGRVMRAQASAERPRVAGALFRGRRAAEAPVLAGALFAICGRSQAIAAAAAVETARGEPAGAAMQAARAARMAAENVHEHAWRLLVDWPRLAGREPEVAALAAAREALAPLLAAEAGADLRDAVANTRDWAAWAVFGSSAEEFLALAGVPALEAWAKAAATPVATLASAMLASHASLGACDVALLPEGDASWIAREIAPALDREAGFDEAPHWLGEARETGPLVRTAAHPLVADAVATWGRGVGARLVARLVDLAATLVALGAAAREGHGAVALASGGAIAWVETTRGLLVHRVALDGERIADYRIVAPTEWNFHPEGAFARGALGLAAGDGARLERELRWLIASLDPCVGVRFEAGHA